MPQSFKNLLKWRKFAKSGHTDWARSIYKLLKFKAFRMDYVKAKTLKPVLSQIGDAVVKIT